MHLYLEIEPGPLTGTVLDQLNALAQQVALTAFRLRVYVPGRQYIQAHQVVKVEHVVAIARSSQTLVANHLGGVLQLDPGTGNHQRVSKPVPVINLLDGDRLESFPVGRQRPKNRLGAVVETFL